MFRAILRTNCEGAVGRAEAFEALAFCAAQCTERNTVAIPVAIRRTRRSTAIGAFKIGAAGADARIADAVALVGAVVKTALLRTIRTAVVFKALAPSSHAKSKGGAVIRTLLDITGNAAKRIIADTIAVNAPAITRAVVLAGFDLTCIASEALVAGAATRFSTDAVVAAV